MIDEREATEERRIRFSGALRMVCRSLLFHSLPWAGAELALLNRGGLKDALNGCIQQGVELGIGLLGRQSLDQRPREARDDAVIPAQALVGFFPRITTRECKHPHDLRMPDAIGVEVVLLRQRELEEDQLPGWQLVELLE